MFHLCRDQVDNLHLYLKRHSSTENVFFKHFASKNQLPGFYISGILVENGLRNASRNTIKWKEKTKVIEFRQNKSIGREVREKLCT